MCLYEEDLDEEQQVRTYQSWTPVWKPPSALPVRENTQIENVRTRDGPIR